MSNTTETASFPLDSTVRRWLIRLQIGDLFKDPSFFFLGE